MVKGKFISGQEDLTEIYKIRSDVFGECTARKNRQDMPDERCMHVIGYDEGYPAAAGSIYYDGWDCIIHSVAVRENCRGKGLGDFVVRMLIDRAFLAGVSEISAAVPDQAAGLFEKIGFRTVQGKKTSGKENDKIMKLHKSDLHKCCDGHA